MRLCMPLKTHLYKFKIFTSKEWINLEKIFKISSSSNQLIVTQIINVIIMMKNLVINQN